MKKLLSMILVSILLLACVPPYISYAECQHPNQILTPTGQSNCQEYSFTYHLITTYYIAACPDCGETNPDYYKRTIEEHSIDSNGQCFCGYCKHNAYTEYNFHDEYRKTGSDTSHEKRATYDKSCNFCSDTTSVYSDWETEAHDFDKNGACQKCSFDKGATITPETCSHDLQYGKSERKYNHDWASNDFHIFRAINYIYCSACDTILSAEEPSQWFSELHSYNSANRCTKCGYSYNPCTHENQVDGDVVDASYQIEENNRYYHHVEKTYQVICVDCGDVEKAYFSGPESHSFDSNNQCTKCRYQLNTAATPITTKPTVKPTTKPTATPITKPTAKPTATPIAKHTAKPTATSIAKHTAKPSATPTAKTTAKPTVTSSTAPSTVVPKNMLSDYLVTSYGLQSVTKDNTLTYLMQTGGYRYGRVLENVVGIEDNAFENRLHLNIDLSDTVKWIGNQAFKACTINAMYLPNGVERIGDEAFAYCENLQTVVIPASVSYIGKDAFIGCAPSLLLKVQPGSYAEQYCWEYGFEYTYYDEAEEKALAQARAKTLYEIDDYYFYFEQDNSIVIAQYYFHSKQKELIIPEQLLGYPVKAIDSYAFNMCYNLTSVTIPTSVISIGKALFANCKNLKTIYVYENSYAKQYCIDNNLSYEIISESAGPIEVKAKASNVYLRNKKGSAIDSIDKGDTFYITGYDSDSGLFTAEYNDKTGFVKGTGLNISRDELLAAFIQ